jgi:hypothetical protein
MTRLVMAASLLWLFLPAPAGAAEPPATSCIGCHGDPQQFEAAEREVVIKFKDDVHASVGLSCNDCHGGNPDPRLIEDAEEAMNPDFSAAPFRGVPDRRDIPSFCGRCHSDPSFMKRWKPDARVDQEAEYRTSNHGRGLAAGDLQVATCVDCHGFHGIRRIEDPKSPVHPTNVAETCRTCHGDPQRMAGRTTPDGRTLPVDQYDRWRRSVHAAALLERGDLSSPTCNDCHGNHGATPPGVESVAFVCGQCHGREADLFRASPKHSGFQNHNALFAESGSAACADCHGEKEPQAALTGIHSFSECAICHDNHAIVRPTMALLGSLPETPCAFCHEGPASVTADSSEPERVRRAYTERRDALLAEAARLGLQGNARFDWLVDQALRLPTHTQLGSGENGAEATLRPEFDRLFRKFRIGKTTYTYYDPALGKEVIAPVRNCAACHGEHPELSDEATGLRTAREFLRRMEELTVVTARAERALLAAQRGGVEVREGPLALDKAVDSQIELEVLVHTFDSDTSGLFVKKHAEGIQHAEAALAAGRSGLRELGQRRTGLIASLVFIVLTLGALGLRIRHLSREDDTRA